MEHFYELFAKGFNYFYSLNAIPNIALFLAFFAILKLSDIVKGLLLILIFSSGVLVNLMLLGFEIFTIQNNYILTLITVSTLLFAFWNFSYNPGQTRRRGGSFSSRYLLAFVLGLLHSIYIFGLFSKFLSTNQVVNILGFWSGAFISMYSIFLVDIVILWLLITFLRIKEQSWLLVVSGIAIGMATSIYITF